jgi:hypothetical protein
VLAVLLLAFVTHSSTVEIAHQHGNLLSARSTSTASFIGINTDHSAPESSRSTGECLICQLHQHLFSTLLITIPGIAPPQAEEAAIGHKLISSISAASAPHRGRAPPQATLL